MAKKNRPLRELKNRAYALYMRSEKTYEQISTEVGVSKDTIGEWVKKGNWKNLRAANTVTRGQALANQMVMIIALQDVIKEQNPPVPTSAQSDQLIKMGKVVEMLDKKVSIQDYITVQEEFLKWLSQQNHELAKTVAPLNLEFLSLVSANKIDDFEIR